MSVYLIGFIFYNKFNNIFNLYKNYNYKNPTHYLKMYNNWDKPLLNIGKKEKVVVKDEVINLIILLAI